jgi:phage FluMu protein Com
MADEIYKYVWRCVRCSNHFANISFSTGTLKEEKKCPKCKSINYLTLNNGDIYVHCRQLESGISDNENSYGETYV